MLIAKSEAPVDFIANDEKDVQRGREHAIEST
jgi:hypothetical protein